MHEEGLVHGDLKGVRFLVTWSSLYRQLTYSQANILINNSGHACLADFGLATIASDQSISISSCVQGGTIQWMSPELIDPEGFGLTEIRPTKESDCYALGMVIYEVLSGHAPFAPFRLTPVIWKVLNGERPERSQGEGGVLFPDDLWRTLELCWKHQPGDRINAKVVLQCLERTSSLPRSSSDVSEVVGTGTGGQSDATARNSGMVLFSIPSVSLGLTSSRPRCIIGPTITRSGNGPSVPLPSLRYRAIATTTRSGDGLVVPSRSLRHHVATVSSTLPSPHSNPQAYPNCLPGTTGLPVPPRGHPPDTTSSTTPLDGGKLPAPPWQGRSREGLVSRLMHKARGKLVKTST